MKFHLDTYYKDQDAQGNVIACLDLHVETALPEFRDRLRKAIEQALQEPREIDQKPSAIGFSHD